MAAMSKNRKNLKKSSSPKPLDGIQWNLVWSISNYSSIKFVQMSTLRQYLVPPMGGVCGVFNVFVNFQKLVAKIE